MPVKSTLRLLAASLALMLTMTIAASAQSVDDIKALNAQVADLYRQGKYPAAIELAKQSLALTEQIFGPDHRAVAEPMNNLAVLYRSMGRNSEAEPLYKRSLAINETALGPDHLEVAGSLNNLSELYQAQGRYGEAEPLIQRDIALREKALGSDHPEVGRSLNNLAKLYERQGRYGEAEPLYKRALGLFEKGLGTDHPEVATVLNNLAGLLVRAGRLAAAEPLYRRSLAIGERSLGPDHPDIAWSLNGLALLLKHQGRFSEAELLYRRALALREKALGPDHTAVGASLNNLAELYRAQGRTADVEPLLKRDLAILEKAFGPDHPDVAISLNNLAGLYEGLGRPSEAMVLYQRSLGINEKALGPEHPVVGGTSLNVAALHNALGRYDLAEQGYLHGLGILLKAHGEDNPAIAGALNGLATLYGRQGRTREAGRIYERSLALSTRTLGPDHPDVIAVLNNWAWLALAQQDLQRAAERWRASTGAIRRRAERGLASARDTSGQGEGRRWSWHFAGLVKTTHRLAAERPGGPGDPGREMLEVAQWAAASEAGQSLAQMAVRGATGSPALAELVRERQDLVADWQAKDKLLIAARSRLPAPRNAAAEQHLSQGLSGIDSRLAQIDAQLAKDFPDFVALASFQPASVGDLQADLKDDEALVLMLDTSEMKPMPEETFVWVVTRTDMRWVRSQLGTASLAREVAALRCGLDLTAWDREATAPSCSDLLQVAADAAPKQANALPFDAVRAHHLYKALLGEVEDLIKDKHLLLVPSGPLTQLPFQVLVTKPPVPGDHRATAWLARDHALTVLPAASSLKALRRLAKPSTAARPMIGFGNPLLDGDQSHAQFGAYYKQQAALARASQICGTKVPDAANTRVVRRRSLGPVSMAGRIADLTHLKAQSPLPETSQELCDVADALNVDRANIHLGTRATEREVKRGSASGALADYRIIHFATHGTLAGQLSGTAEPGLILTPPTVPSEEDDGYLSASEIAELKLDADWVILSACNTAGGAGALHEGQALSGLARAFFYAQARALLVSHWEVDSAATVKLITSAVGAMAKDKSVGRAEALRQAMLSMIGSGHPLEVHPAYWAPFVVVGEGGGAGVRAVVLPAASATVSPVSDDARAGGATVEGPAAAPAAPTPAPSAKARGRTKPTPAKPAAPADDWVTRVFPN